MNDYLSIINCPYNENTVFDLEDLDARTDEYLEGTLKQMQAEYPPLATTRHSEQYDNSFRSAPRNLTYRSITSKLFKAITHFERPETTTCNSRSDKSENGTDFSKITGVLGKEFTLINSKVPINVGTRTYSPGKKVLGTGASGKVREGAWHDKANDRWIPVAVKKVSTGYGHRMKSAEKFSLKLLSGSDYLDKPKECTVVIQENYPGNYRITVFDAFDEQFPYDIDSETPRCSALIKKKFDKTSPLNNDEFIQALFRELKYFPTENPKWKRISGQTLLDSTTGVLLAMELNDKENFLTPIDYALFEQVGKKTDRKFPFIKLYTFLPRCKSDLRAHLTELALAPTIKPTAARCLDILKALHARNVVHMDIKPENFLVDDSNHILLGDFEFATKIDPYDHQTLHENVNRGTRKYMPSALNEGEWIKPMTGKKLRQRDLIAFAQMLHYMGSIEDPHIPANEKFITALPTVSTTTQLQPLLFPNGRPSTQHTLREVAREVLGRILIDGNEVKVEDIQNMHYFRM